MINTLQQSISKMRLRTASTALTLAVVLVFGVVTTQSAQAQTFTDLYSFRGSPDGANPYGAGLIRDAAGNLYGTTENGGPSGEGVVFKVDAHDTESVLYSFTGVADGGHPEAGLIRDAAGTLYGTTPYGGNVNYCYPSGCGTVFKVDTGGTETVLHSFTGTTDGASPLGGLIRDDKGPLYGTTEAGGPSNVGTVFKVSKSGTETVLHTFTRGSSDGAYPIYTSLLTDPDGNLYGVAEEGGTSNLGVLYKLSKKGNLTLLHSFAGGTTNGCYPSGTPVMDKTGNLYGTTISCGAFGAGIVWKVSKKGGETVLHSFAGGSSDGGTPRVGVIMDAMGNLYGDTVSGGPSNVGTVYELNKKGKLTLLHSFDGSDGANPFGGLIRNTKGDLYGTTVGGGSSGNGTVWRLTP